jgi:L-threonylcarbamoyladenylate synthase
VLTTPEQLLPAVYAWRTQGLRVGVLTRTARPSDLLDDAEVIWVEAPTDAAGYARALYRTLRTLDGKALDRILVEAVPETEDWAAIADRLQRATWQES